MLSIREREALGWLANDETNVPIESGRVLHAGDSFEFSGNLRTVDERTLHCVCGATRVVPNSLAIASCVLCGRRLGPRLPTMVPAPSLVVLVVASTLAALVCAASLGVALAWSVQLRDLGPPVIAWSAVSFLGMIGAWKAYGGGVIALVVEAAICGSVAVVCVVSSDTVLDLLHVAHVVPGLLTDGSVIVVGVAIAAAFACTLCICAVPQARRYVAWQLGQLERNLR